MPNLFFCLKTNLQNAMYEDAKAKFFACTDQDMQEYYEMKEANKPIDPKTLVK